MIMTFVGREIPSRLADTPVSDTLVALAGVGPVQGATASTELSDALGICAAWVESDGRPASAAVGGITPIPGYR